MLLMAGGVVIAARLYLMLLPLSAALGALMVVATGGALAWTLLALAPSDTNDHGDRQLTDYRF
jgi:hypothetical protein